ncbi:MAG TPA: tol-pal system protein YbgF [Candidatus Deferrimicrobiaceae bacterium]|nr:tol-pal system protein YbgF [Candidatus Deferrimicrobiaceae bacterium]
MCRTRLASLLCLALLAAAAGGCAVADTGAFVRVQEDMEALKRDVAAMKQSGSATPLPAGGGRDELSSFQRNLADLASDNDRIKADLLAVGTRADDTRLEMQKEVTRLNGTTAELSKAVQEMRAKVDRIEAIEKRIAAIEEKLEPGAAGRPSAAPAPQVAVEDLKTPEEVYDYALGLIKVGDTKKGREVLNAFAARYPDHRLMQNVFYWKGETFYVEKDYESAILSFQDVVDKFPGGEKAPDAMLKQGFAFQALNDKKNARILYELLQSKYPRSPAAEKARQKLTELK